MSVAASELDAVVLVEVVDLVEACFPIMVNNLESLQVGGGAG